MKAFRAIVSGRVQMVMYRDFAKRAARAHGIVGAVRNLSDSTVEIIAEGEEMALKTYAEKLKRGSMLSRVERVDVEWRAPTYTFTDFTILF